MEDVSWLEKDSDKSASSRQTSLRLRMVLDRVLLMILFTLVGE